MYKIGDYIVYGGNGVCKVTQIGSLDIPGIDKEKKYYTLQTVFSKGSTLYTPVDNDKVIMRRVLTKDEAMELIDNIHDIPIIWVTNDKLREMEFKETMRKCTCDEWIKLIKTIYIRKEERISQGKKITSTDDKYMKAAEDFLYSELSIALDMPKDEVEEFIVNRLDSNTIVNHI